MVCTNFTSHSFYKRVNKKREHTKQTQCLACYMHGFLYIYSFGTSSQYTLNSCYQNQQAAKKNGKTYVDRKIYRKKDHIFMHKKREREQCLFFCNVDTIFLIFSCLENKLRSLIVPKNTTAVVLNNFSEHSCFANTGEQLLWYTPPIV